MGRSFAGILGVLAFSTTVLRGAIAGHSAETTLLTATCYLFAFAAAGWILGMIAQNTVDDSVRARFATELQAAQEQAENAKSVGKTK